MPNCKTLVPFEGTAEQEGRLREVITAHKDEQGPLIPILHEAQEIYGYLPYEVQTIIAEELDTPLSEVYGVSTFYSRFNLNPKGENQVSVCLGTACYLKGASSVLAEVEKVLGCEVGKITEDGKFSVDSTRCVGACGLAPILLVNDDVYGQVKPEQVAGILVHYM